MGSCSLPKHVRKFIESVAVESRESIESVSYAWVLASVLCKRMAVVIPRLECIVSNLHEVAPCLRVDGLHHVVVSVLSSNACVDRASTSSI